MATIVISVHDIMDVNSYKTCIREYFLLTTMSKALGHDIIVSELHARATHLDKMITKTITDSDDDTRIMLRAICLDIFSQMI